MWLINVVIGINLIGLGCIFTLTNRGGYWDALLYPALEDFLCSACLLNQKKRDIVITLFTIVFFPAIIFYFTLLTIIMTVIVVIVGLYTQYQKYKNKYKEK